MKRLISASCAAIALAITPATPVVAQEAGTVASVSQQGTGEGPALWKLQDEDTTIYLFGTIHLLPPNVEWLNAPIANALASSDILITEIPAGAGEDAASQAVIMRKATLPEGKTLRGLLSAEQRKSYEAGLRQMRIPAQAFDRMEPWMVGMTMALLPLVQAGYSPEAGVEEVLEASAPPTMDRGALETFEQQMNMLDSLPMASQIHFMVEAAKDPARTVASTDEMVNSWLKGDSDAIGRLTAEEMTDPTVNAVLLYDRNKAWSEWIDARMDRPGVVFIAVGAAHLAGTKSVQDYLGEAGIETTRVQ